MKPVFLKRSAFEWFGLLVALSLAGSVLLLSNCGSPDPCPTPSFASIQKNVFATTCALSSCHQAGASATVGNLDLVTDSYRALLGASGTGTPANDPVGFNYRYNGMLLVKPGDAANSLLYLKLTNSGSVGCAQTSCPYGEQMPYGSAQLAQCSLDAVKQWIDSAALNN